MKRKKKINPRRVPVSLADVNRTREETSDKAIHLSFAIFLTVLLDDFGFDQEQIQHAWARADKLSKEIKEKRIKLRDLVEVLRDEYHVDLFK